jgi:putative flippase GtrA
VTVILTNPRERIRFLRFAVVGIIGAAIDFGVMNLLTRGLAVRLVIAGTISFIAAVLSNFIWNRYWTYPDSRSKAIARQFVEFAVINAIGLVIRVPILAFGQPLLYTLMAALPFHFPILDARSISNNLTLAIAVVIVMFWNFFVNRYWTYSDIK